MKQSHRLFTTLLFFVGCTTTTSSTSIDPSTACDGSGYATYENGIYIGGTGPCNDDPNNYCCSGNNSCKDFTGTVCYGNSTNINCYGSQSCDGATIGLVKGGSCNEFWSCNDARSDIIDGGSCIGNSACFGANSKNIVDASCVGGIKSCSFTEIEVIEDGSCTSLYVLGDGDIVT